MAAKTAEDLWDALIDLGVSEETLQIVTDINGYSVSTLNDVLFAKTGYRSLDQIEDDSKEAFEEAAKESAIIALASGPR